MQDLHLLFIACHFIWVLFPGHFARWEEAENAVMSVRLLMMLQGFHKDAKQCLHKKGLPNYICGGEKRSFFSSLCHPNWCMCEKILNLFKHSKFSLCLSITHCMLNAMSEGGILYSSLRCRKQIGYCITDSLPSTLFTSERFLNTLLRNSLFFCFFSSK